jgi:hypothetical protein
MAPMLYAKACKVMLTCECMVYAKACKGIGARGNGRLYNGMRISDGCSEGSHSAFTMMTPTAYTLAVDAGCSSPEKKSH